MEEVFVCKCGCSSWTIFSWKGIRCSKCLSEFDISQVKKISAVQFNTVMAQLVEEAEE